MSASEILSISESFELDGHLRLLIYGIFILDENYINLNNYFYSASRDCHIVTYSAHYARSLEMGEDFLGGGPR